jgi:uncharacterized protein YqhQ
MRRFIARHRYLPLPQAMRWLLLFGASAKEWTLFLIVLGGLVLAIESCSRESQVFCIWQGAMVAIFFAGLMVNRIKVGRWHGAEHMVALAYQTSDLTTMDEIVKHSPVHPKCGSRLLFPFFCLLLATRFLSVNLNTYDTIVLFGGLEIILWVDVFLGWEKIPGASFASYLLQKHVTTQAPGPKELKVAQLALEKLILAHEEKNS